MLAGQPRVLLEETEREESLFVDQLLSFVEDRRPALSVLEPRRMRQSSIAPTVPC